MHTHTKIYTQTYIHKGPLAVQVVVMCKPDVKILFMHVKILFMRRVCWVSSLGRAHDIRIELQLHETSVSHCFSGIIIFNMLLVMIVSL